MNDEQRKVLRGYVDYHHGPRSTALSNYLDHEEGLKLPRRLIDSLNLIADDDETCDSSSMNQVISILRDLGFGTREYTVKPTYTRPDILRKQVQSSLDKQVGGGHYKDMVIQPIEYCQKNKLNFCESMVIKYVSRHRNKNGRQDIEKAIHALELLLELEYSE